jgi:hypothetical protein
MTQLYNYEVHIFRSSSNVTRVIKSRNTRWLGNIGHTGEMKYLQDFSGNPRRKRPTGGYSRDAKIIQWISKEQVVRM